MLFFWLILVFLLGAVIGSFLNVCIYRVPQEKSVFWPGSRCGHCYQPIRGYDNIPLVSYWLLRGRCRTCKAKFSPRYFIIELVTALSFLGLFYLEVVVNVNSLVYIDRPAHLSHRPLLLPREPGAPLTFDDLVRLRNAPWLNVLNYQRDMVERGEIPWRAWVVFCYHAVLLSFLIVVSCCDLNSREIPLTVTMTGTAIGLIGATLLPWPWPYPPDVVAQGIPAGRAWWEVDPRFGPRTALYPWPVWGPLPEWLAGGGNWQTGLLTGVVGMLVGTFMLRTVRLLFSMGLGIEAMGLGDADLMMMAGAFLGWQPVVMAFFVSVIPALIIGIIQYIVSRDNSLPFGPSLALGVVMTWLGWRWIGPYVQVLFFNATLMLILAGASCVLLLVLSYAFRLRRLSRG
jgi:leader peptidase (prepilin peptidase)/N-methyltransferase